MPLVRMLFEESLGVTVPLLKWWLTDKVDIPLLTAKYLVWVSGSNATSIEHKTQNDLDRIKHRHLAKITWKCPGHIDLVVTIELRTSNKEKTTITTVQPLYEEMFSEQRKPRA
jgi:hypothetical protein